jgi:hypothetical protein
MCNAKHLVYAVIEKMAVFPVTPDSSFLMGVTDRISLRDSRYTLG